MSKKRLTKKRKKQLLAMFMATGMMTQSFIGSVEIFAEEAVSSRNITETFAKKEQSINFTHIANDATNCEIIGVSIDENGHLRVKKTLGMAVEKHYSIYGYGSTNDPNEMELIDEMNPESYSDLSILISNKTVKEYPIYNCYFIQSENGKNLVSINLADLADFRNQGDLTANNATVEYGSTWNDDVAKQVTGVKATDKYGNDVTSNVSVSGNVDTTKPGDYKVTFSSPDLGKEKTVNVTVKASQGKAATPVFNTPYIYGDDLVGKTSPNATAQLRIAQLEDIQMTVRADSNGNFQFSGQFLENYPDYKVGNQLYVTASFTADMGTDETTSDMTTVTIEENHTSIEANDFNVDYGFDLTDEVAIEKAGAKATDKYGKSEGVRVKESNVDTSKPGEYSITFISDSGKEKTVKVTVKEQEVTKPNAPVITSNPYYYGDNLIGEIAPGLTVKVYPNGGNLDNALEFETTSGTFAFTAEELKKAFGNRYSTGNLLAVVAYDKTTGKTSYVTPVMILPKAPTLVAESTIHVAYGSDWNDDIAKKQAKVKATDVEGNDVTKDVKVKSNPVDTSKPGNYTVEFSVTENGLTTTAKTTVIVDEKQVIGSEPVIHASDTTYQVGETLNPLLGVTAEDPEDGDLTNQVKADASGVNMSKAGDYELKLSVTDKDGNTTEQTVTVHVVDQVTDGPVIKGADDTSIDLNTKFDPLAGVTAQDSQGNDLTERLTYTGTVDTSTTGEYTINYYVYDKDGKVATTERKVTVNEPTVEPTIEAHDFEVDYGFDLTDGAAIEKAEAKATDKYGKEEAVTVKENKVDTNKPGEYSITFVSASGKEKTVQVTVKDQAPMKPTVDPIKEGAGKVTGQGQAGDKIVITVGGAEVGTGTVNDDGKFDILTGTYRAKAGDVYAVQAFNSDNESSEVVDVKVVTTAGEVNPNDYMIGELSITGTYSGDVTTIAVFVDGVELGKTSGVNVSDGQFNFYVGNRIKAGQKVTVSGYDKYGKQLDKKEVSIRNGVEAPVVNDIHEGETTVTGTGEVGSTIYVKDHKKNIIGQAEVKEDGSFEVTIPAQSKDTKLIVMAKKGNLRSEDVNKTVLEGLPIQLTVNDIYEGETTVTGTSEVGSTVYVKDHAKNIISQAKVKEDGTYEVTISAQKKGTKLIVMAKKGNVRSEDINKTVIENQ